MSDDREKSRSPGGLGCALIPLVLIVLDFVGMCAGAAHPYGPLALGLAAVGFVCGAALGKYFSVKTIPPTFWSPDYWLYCGLAGMAIPVCIIYSIFKLIADR